MDVKRDNTEAELQPENKRVERDNNNDWISSLPDEVLVLILSRLPLKEAGRTSVISSRWKDLWKYTSGLNFDAGRVLDNFARNWKKKNLKHVERRKYINWVNSVIRLHKGLALEEFRIWFDFDKRGHKAITQWLQFAFTKKVERLTLELHEYGGFFKWGSKPYAFPVDLFSQVTGGTSTVSTVPRLPHAPFDAKALKTLCLKSVDVTDDDIGFFLCNCPLLEELIVHRSNKLSKLKACGSSLMLKHLEILYCKVLSSIMISAPNLTSLKLTCIDGLVLVNVPMLVNVSIYSLIDELYENKFVPTVRGIPQLESLTLRLHHLMDGDKAWKFPELPKLKKLKIIYFAKGDESLMGLTSFIEASPNLQEFVLKMEWSHELSREKGEIESYGQGLHQNLKVIKFIGYYGRAGDIEFIRYALLNCPVLEKIIIDPHFQKNIPRRPLKPDELEAERTAKICAQQLCEGELSSRVKFIVV